MEERVGIAQRGIQKSSYIKMISIFSDRYGNLLIELMDNYGCSNLQQVTEEQSKEFYEKLIADMH